MVAFWFFKKIRTKEGLGILIIILFVFIYLLEIWIRLNSKRSPYDDTVIRKAKKNIYIAKKQAS